MRGEGGRRMRESGSIGKKIAAFENFGGGKSLSLAIVEEAIVWMVYKQTAWLHQEEKSNFQNLSSLRR